MIRSLRAVRLGFIVLVSTIAVYGHAQATPTASQGYQLSVFGGGTGNFTGLLGGKNLDVTAGADLGFRSFFRLNPSIEVRGTFPIKKGHIASEKNVVAGLKVQKDFGRLHPYVDFLVGRGAVDYSRPYPDATGSIFYIRTTGLVYSPGIGADLDITNHFSLKADFQIQRYSTPILGIGHLNSKATTGAIVYRFDFNHHRHQRY
ncbi:hypothetical protein [Granulicella sp. dw_53]|uniref:hypothetical protein n=1 Tax=Granulicella sp. dw_53 TaxID=2719792 RepID=UPI001BD2A010|nr:hypothetical protein [Granulicella sp. dw_53]